MRTRRRRKTPYKRDDVFARWGGRCVYCNAPAAHLDHVQPLSRGGRDLLSNVVPACAPCNLDKAARSLAEWVESWQALDTTEAQHKQESTEGERR
jgi:5-methylcytosine-specific restriction endonuclease McrA